MFLIGIGSLGPMELLIILGIVVLLFGAGKLSGLGRDLGQGIREFKKATTDPEAEAKKRTEEERLRAETSGRYVATNGTADSRPVDAVTSPPQASNPAPVVRPPDFTGR